MLKLSDIKKPGNVEAEAPTLSSSDFDEKAYSKVNERISKFRKDYEKGSIVTLRDVDEDGVCFTAVILRDLEEAELYGSCGYAAATGRSFLPHWAKDRKMKVEEYSETVAIGRALAILGYEVEKAIASQEEMERFETIYKDKEAPKVEAKESQTADEKDVPKEVLIKTNKVLKTGARLRQTKGEV